MSAGYTPGPWKAEYDGDIERWIVRAAGEPDWRIADTVLYAEPDHTGEDNARLIAAAPSLVDALEALFRASGSRERQIAMDSAKDALRLAGRLP